MTCAYLYNAYWSSPLSYFADCKILEPDSHSWRRDEPVLSTIAGRKILVENKEDSEIQNLRDFYIGAYYFEKEGRFGWRWCGPTARPFLADSEKKRRRRGSAGTCSRCRSASRFAATTSCSAS